jgi:hypothetical protein
VLEKTLWAWHPLCTDDVCMRWPASSVQYWAGSAYVCVHTCEQILHMRNSKQARS